MMQDEHFLNYAGLTSEYVKSYIGKNFEVNEFTCLVPKGDHAAESLLRENGFRYTGKRSVGGKIMVVFKWFRDLDQKHEDMRSFFNRRVDDYDLHMRDGNDSHEIAFTSLVKDIPNTDDKIAVLDLGCGTGAELKFIFQKAPNAHVFCMDVSERMLEKLRENYRDYSNNIEITCASYLVVDFGEKSYDYVVACNTLHHLLAEDKLDLYVRIRKAMKDNRYLLILDYVAASPEEEQSLRTSYLELINSGTINKNEIYHIDLPLTMEHEADLLEGAGFNVTRTERTGEKEVIISARA